MLKCTCRGCGETWYYSSNISPMLVESKWEKVLKFFNLKDLSNTFICYKCMEKALGRKLRRTDINNFPFNEAFKDWYCFGNNKR